MTSHRPSLRLRKKITVAALIPTAQPTYICIHAPLSTTQALPFRFPAVTLTVWIATPGVNRHFIPNHERRVEANPKLANY